MIFLYAAEKAEDRESHDNNVWFLMKWVQQFLELGDVFGDMITTGMIEHGDMQKMFTGMVHLGSEAGRVLFDIWGALCNNDRFMTAGALAFLKAEKEFRKNTDFRDFHCVSCLRDTLTWRKNRTTVQCGNQPSLGYCR